MKKAINRIAVAMLFALLGVQSLSNVYASCGGSVLFGQPWYCVYPKEATFGRLDVTLFGDWWALGSGNPSNGIGNDRGTFIYNTTADWLHEYYPLPGCYYMPVGTDNWAQPGTDGCIINDPEQGPMIVTFDDRANDGSTAYFAVACVARIMVEAPEYNFDYAAAPSGCNSDPNNIYLIEIPILLANSQKHVPHGTSLDLTWPYPSCGFYSDGSALCIYQNVIRSYEIYYWQGLSEPTDRNASAWILAPDTDGNISDNHATVFVPDPAKHKMSSWIALRLIYDSGFNSRYVGRSMLVKPCRPTDEDNDNDD